MADAIPETSNPYAPPVAPIGAFAETGPLSDMSFAQISKLRNHSHTIRSLGGLWALGATIELGFGLWFTVGPTPVSFPNAWIFLPIGALTGLACYGAWARPTWGRIVAIVMCVLCLAGLNWLGIIIGILGLIALFGSGTKLFGPGRLTHRDLEAEFKRQKAEQKGRATARKAKRGR